MNPSRSLSRSFFHAAVLGCALSPATLIGELACGSIPLAQAAQGASAENKAAARDLTVEGIRLAEAGDCESAVPKFERAEKLYHAVTILTWIGKCQLQMGRLVEGTETLNRVVREKLSDDAPDAYTDAQADAQVLITEARPKIAKLTIRVVSQDGELHELEGLEVQVDSVPMSQALVGAPRPTDPGKHEVTVSAPGYHSTKGEIELAPGSREELTLTLKPDPQASAGASGGDSVKDGADAESDGNTRKVVTWSLIGGGAAFMAAGGVMGGLALKQEGDLTCEPNVPCDASQEDTLDGAKTKATLSTIFFGVGGAAAATGIILLLTGSSEPEAQVGSTTLKPTLGWGSLGVSGQF